MSSSGSITPLLRVDDLSVTLKTRASRHRAVNGVSFTILPGETLCLVGESGAGKSMLASAITGLLPLGTETAGQILLRETDLLSLSDKALCSVRGREIGMIFQEPMTSLNPITRVVDQIAEPFKIHEDLDAEQREYQASSLLEEVGLNRSLGPAFPHELSGGQRQRVMIAIAVALKPKLLIADEPTTALDVTTQKQILNLLSDLKKSRGMSILYVTHDFGVVAEIANRIVVMRHGKVVEEGETEQVLARPRQAYTQQLLKAVPSLTPPPPRQLSGAKPLLSVYGLSKRYRAHGSFKSDRQIQAVRNVSFAIRRGETLGLVGESGAGKSTVGRCVMRLVDADAGEIRIDGSALQGLPQRALLPYRRRMQMIFQDPFASLNPRRSIGRIIAEGPILQGNSKKASFDRAEKMLSLVGLTSDAFERYPHEFSGGQRQRIGIARALALDPEILIADEPLSALDVSIQAQILSLLRCLQEKLGLAMLFITHDLRVAAQMCDRIAVMLNGSIVEEAETGRLFSQPRHGYTRKLLEAVPDARLP